MNDYKQLNFTWTHARKAFNQIAMMREKAGVDYARDRWIKEVGVDDKGHPLRRIEVQGIDLWLDAFRCDDFGPYISLRDDEEGGMESCTFIISADSLYGVMNPANSTVLHMDIEGKCGMLNSGEMPFLLNDILETNLESSQHVVTSVFHTTAQIHLRAYKMQNEGRIRTHEIFCAFRFSYMHPNP